MTHLRLRNLQALEATYDRYAGVVMAVCLRIVRDHAVAAEVVEAVFVDLWNDPQRFGDSLINRLVSHAREIAIQRRSAPAASASLVMDPLPSDPDDEPQLASNVRWHRARVRRALTQIPEDARQVIEMICLDAWNIAEVASRLKLTPDLVRQRLAAGMRSLSDALRVVPPAIDAVDLDQLWHVNLDRVRVLVVDDEPDARGALIRVLQTAGAVVTTASGVAEAMALLPETNPDVLLSDLAMPDEDGFDLIRRIRRGGRTVKDLPAIAVTAFASKQTRRDAMLAGFQTHVEKPVNPRELAEVIASFTGRTGWIA